MRERSTLQMAATRLTDACGGQYTAKTRNPHQDNIADIQKQIAQIRQDFGLPKNISADKRLAKAKPEDFPALRWTPKVVT